MAGLDIAIEPRKRTVFVFEARDRFADMPLLLGSTELESLQTALANMEKFGF